MSSEVCSDRSDIWPRLRGMHFIFEPALAKLHVWMTSSCGNCESIISLHNWTFTPIAGLTPEELEANGLYKGSVRPFPGVLAPMLGIYLCRRCFDLWNGGGSLEYVPGNYLEQI